MGYPTKPLGEVAEIASGYGFPHKYQGRTDGEIPFYKVGDMNTPGNEVTMSVAQHTVTRSELVELRAKAFPSGTVIMPKIGAAIRTGKKRILGSEAAYDNNVVGIVPRDGVLDSSYLFHWAKTVDFSLLAQDSDVPSLRKSVLQSLLIVVPPIEEQRRIADLLDEADRLQRLRKEANEKAQRILPTLFSHMFGDLDTNPMGWETLALADVLENIETGWSPRCVERPARGDEWGVLKLGAVSWNWYDESANKTLPTTVLPKKNLAVQTGDILMSRKNTRALVGASVMVDRTSPRLLFPDLMFRLCPNDRVEPHYLWGALQTHSVREQIRERASGSAASMCNVSQGRLREVRIMLPPLEIQQAFSQLAGAIAQARRKDERATGALIHAVSTLRSRLFAESA